MDNDKREERPFFIDKAGRNVIVGDYIVYGHNLGRCAGLRFGKVLKIAVITETWHGDEEWRITVQEVDDDWSFEDLRLCRKGCLNFPNRIMKVNEIIPENYKEILKGAN
jgi:hypothetical protein